MLKKHQSDASDSVIRGQLRLDLDSQAQDIIAGLDDNARAKQLEKDLEAIYERRNNRALNIYPILQRISKSLQSEYGAANLRRMGDHGFTVDDTPRPPKAPKASKAGA